MIVQAQKSLKLLQDMIDLSKQYDIDINAYMLKMGSGRSDRAGCVSVGDYDFVYRNGEVCVDYVPSVRKKTVSTVNDWEPCILPERIVDLKAPPKKERPLRTRQANQ